MTQTVQGESDDGGTAAPAVPEHAAEPAVPPPRRPARMPQGVWVAALFALLIVGIGTSPFWGPAVAPLLPWGERVASPAAVAAIAARLDAIERQSAATAAAGRSAEAALAQRIDRLEAQNSARGDLKPAIQAAQSGLQALEQRFAAADARSAHAAADLQTVRQDFTRLDARLTDLGGRFDAIEHRVQAQIGAGRSDAVLLLSLLQLRATVESGGPFAAQYEGFTELARNHPELAAAAQPLAASAGSGVASPAALRRGLDDLAARLAAAAPPSSGREWWQAALARLRGLVTVRRIGAPQVGAEAAVGKAQTSLADGDLAGAVAALGALSGGDAEAAGPWLQRARARLAAEAALGRLQARLTAALTAPPAAVPQSEPNPPSAKPKAPS